jgi:hypothetical protein
VGLVQDVAGRGPDAIQHADGDGRQLSAVDSAEQSERTPAGPLCRRRSTRRHGVLPASYLEVAVLRAASSPLRRMQNPIIPALGSRERRFIIDQSCPSTWSSSYRALS